MFKIGQTTATRGQTSFRKWSHNRKWSMWNRCRCCLRMSGVRKVTRRKGVIDATRHLRMNGTSTELSNSNKVWNTIQSVWPQLCHDYRIPRPLTKGQITGVQPWLQPCRSGENLILSSRCTSIQLQSGDSRSVLGHMSQQWEFDPVVPTYFLNSYNRAPGTRGKCTFYKALSAPVSWTWSTATIILVPIEALCGASTFGDGELNTKTKMSVQLPGSMILSEFQATALLFFHGEHTFGIHRRNCYR
jgi:hypothetical protein